jgi:hypothetical protein
MGKPGAALPMQGPDNITLRHRKKSRMLFRILPVCLLGLLIALISELGDGFIKSDRQPIVICELGMIWVTSEEINGR